MSKIGNYVVGLEELTGAVMALDPFDELFAIDNEYGCSHCLGAWYYNGTVHYEGCPVTNLREVLTKLEQSK